MVFYCCDLQAFLYFTQLTASTLLPISAQIPSFVPRIYGVCDLYLEDLSQCKGTISGADAVALFLSTLCFTRSLASTVYLGQNQDNKNTRCKCKGPRSDVKI